MRNQNDTKPVFIFSNFIHESDFVFTFWNVYFRIINLCQENPGGINEDIIKQDMPQFDVKQRVTAINRLLSTVMSYCVNEFTRYAK